MALSTIHSNVHPDAPWSYCQDKRPTLFLANGVDRPQKWDGHQAATQNWGIVAPTTAPTVSATGTPASGTTLTGSYYYRYSYYNSVTDRYSNPSPLSTVYSASGNSLRVMFSATIPDSQTTHIRLWRNTNGQTTTFYKLADVTGTVDSYEDIISDTALTAAETMETDHNELGSTIPFVAYHHGRVLAYGSRIESRGSVTIASGSAAVSGSGTHFVASHVGQYFHVPGEATKYVVSAVASATGMTLATAHTGGALSGSDYTLSPDATRSQFSWSKTGEPEYFPTANISNVEENDGDVPTGLKKIGLDMFAFKRSHVYALTFNTDPNPLTGDGGITPALVGRGAVNNRSIAVVQNAGFILDQKGIYQFQDFQLTDIDMAVRRLIQPSPEPIANRINWAQREKFHAVHDPKRDRILFFVALGSDTEPKNALVFERLTQRWSVEEYQMAILSSCVMEDSTGRQRVFVGDENGLIWALGVSKSLDGAPPSSSGTLRGTATSGTSTTLTDSGAAFYTSGDGLKGVPVYIEEGTGAGQWNIIKSNTGTALTFKNAWGTNPDDTSKYIIGPIEWILRTKWFALGDPPDKQMLYAIRLFFEPESTDFTLGIKVFSDFSSTAITTWKGRVNVRDSLEIPKSAENDGKIKVHLNDSRGVCDVPLTGLFNHFVSFEFSMIDAERKPKILGYDLIGFPQSGSAGRGL